MHGLGGIFGARGEGVVTFQQNIKHESPEEDPVAKKKGPSKSAKSKGGKASPSPSKKSAAKGGAKSKRGKSKK